MHVRVYMRVHMRVHMLNTVYTCVLSSYAHKIDNLNHKSLCTELSTPQDLEIKWKLNLTQSS